MIDGANEVFAAAEFYGHGRRIYKGLKMVLVDYEIDEGGECQVIGER